MLRKKITNKEKFQFREEDVLSPLPMVGRNSVQSRLAKKADDKLTYNQSETGQKGTFGVFNVNHPGVNGDSRHGVQEGVVTATMTKYQGSPDPVLDQIVAKLKSGLQLSTNMNQATGHGGPNLAAYSPPVPNIIPSTSVVKQDTVPARLAQAVPPASAQSKSCGGGGCICFRPLKLVMCEACGETFRARVSLVCSLHPRAVYLQDVKECKGCKQSDMQALKEFELPAGMEKEIKNTSDRKREWIGRN